MEAPTTNEALTTTEAPTTTDKPNDFQNGDCYQNCSPRLLSTLAKIDKANVTQELCKSICFNEKFKFAGVQYTYEC